MFDQSGSSLIEVLLSLSLLSTSAILLLNQHEMTHRLFYQLHQETIQIFEQENFIESHSLSIHSSIRAQIK